MTFTKWIILCVLLISAGTCITKMIVDDYDDWQNDDWR